MTTSDAVIVVSLLAGVLLILPCGIAFYPFLILRAQMFALARGKYARDPAGLFYGAFVRSFGWGLLFFVLVFVPCAGQMFFFLGGLGGYIGWLVLAIQGWRQNKALQRIQYAPPRLQFGLTDLYAGILAYGLSMALLLAFFPEDKYRDACTLFGTFYFMIAQGFGFYLAQDLLRRIAPPASAGCRAKYLLNIALLASLFLPLVWLAWRAWKYALQQSALTPAPAPRPPAQAQRPNANAGPAPHPGAVNPRPPGSQP
ncbi:MAG: hypothetical protein HY291_05615 [Planctomycetes bacterium]|nr:hypothetical protein [Planctomycetota bacterium]